MSHNKLYRNFIILQEDERGYSTSKDKTLSGYAKIEAKGDKCKVSFYAQNLNPDDRYSMVLICCKKDFKQLIDLGCLKVNEAGKGDVDKEYYINNIAGLGISYEKISGAAICKIKGGETGFIMHGFMNGEESSENWRKFKLVRIEDKKFDSKPTLETKTIKSVKSDNKNMDEPIIVEPKEIKTEQLLKAEILDEVKNQSSDEKIKNRVNIESKDLELEDINTEDSKFDVREEQDFEELSDEDRNKCKKYDKEECNKEKCKNKKYDLEEHKHKECNKDKCKCKEEDDDKKKHKEKDQEDKKYKEDKCNYKEDKDFYKEDKNSYKEDKNFYKDDKKDKNLYKADKGDYKGMKDYYKEDNGNYKEDEGNYKEEYKEKKDFNDIIEEYIEKLAQSLEKYDGEINFDMDLDGDFIVYGIIKDKSNNEYKWKMFKIDKHCCSKPYNFINVKGNNRRIEENTTRDSLDFERYENEIEKIKNSNNFRIKGKTGEYFENLAEDFQPYNQVLNDINYCKWYKVDVNGMEDLCNQSNYNKYTLAYYPMLNYYPYISKNNYFLLGYKCNKEGELKYIVYGIPGSKDKDDQPFGGKTGFVTWTNDDIKNQGYWLMFYDYKNSSIVVPMK